MSDSDHSGETANARRQIVALVGMPGAGKSTIGRAAARKLGVPFIDCDRALEQRCGRTVASIFASDGEAGFRDLESAVLTSLVGEHPALIATGGGAILRVANRELLRTRTHCIYLRATHGLLWGRLRQDRRRPLLQVVDAEERLREMSAIREPLYQETAGVVIDVDDVRLDRIVEAIVRSSNLERPR